MSVSGTGSRIFASLELAWMFPSTVWSIVGGWVLEGRGVVTASPVKDLTEAEETGREVVSGASSNESCSRSELSALDILVSFSAIVVLSILIQGSVVKLRQDSNLHHRIPPLLLPNSSGQMSESESPHMQGSSGPRLDTRRASNGHRFRRIT